MSYLSWLFKYCLDPNKGSWDRKCKHLCRFGTSHIWGFTFGRNWALGVQQTFPPGSVATVRLNWVLESETLAFQIPGKGRRGSCALSDVCNKVLWHQEGN